VKQRTGHMDLVLFLAVLALMLFSVGAVYSASVEISRANNEGDSTVLFVNHAIRVVLGIAAIFIGMFIKYDRYADWSRYILLLAVIFLVLTPLLGNNKLGATRWISIAGVDFQPSEFAKYALVIHLAVLLSDKQKYVHEFRNGFLPMFLWTAVIAGLITFQNNLSMVMVILIVAYLLMFVGRVRVAHLAATVALALPAVAVYALSKDYRIRRIMDFMSSDSSSIDSFDAVKTQVQQAIIGLGNGGLFGGGIGMSKQRELFLPESYGDFIFAIIGEEYGFIGACVILALFVVVLLRGMKIAKRSTDDLGRFLAAGISIAVIVNTLLNAMVTTGIIPTTGLPMPLVSYGGTSILFTAYALGIVLNISMYTRIRPRSPFETGSPRAARSGDVL